MTEVRDHRPRHPADGAIFEALMRVALRGQFNRPDLQPVAYVEGTKTALPIYTRQQAGPTGRVNKRHMLDLFVRDVARVAPDLPDLLTIPRRHGLRLHFEASPAHLVYNREVHGELPEVTSTSLPDMLASERILYTRAFALLSAEYREQPRHIDISSHIDSTRLTVVNGANDEAVILNVEIVEQLAGQLEQVAVALDEGRIVSADKRTLGHVGIEYPASLGYDLAFDARTVLRKWFTHNRA